jgi:hypothetical protein
MMIVPAGVKVHLALGYTDMRSYADLTIMRSPRRECVRRRGVKPWFTLHNWPIG